MDSPEGLITTYRLPQHADHHVIATNSTTAVEELVDSALDGGGNGVVRVHGPIDDSNVADQHHHAGGHHGVVVADGDVPLVVADYQVAVGELRHHGDDAGVVGEEPSGHRREVPLPGCQRATSQPDATISLVAPTIR